MAGPFYNCVKGTTSGAPGSGGFTPNAAAGGFQPWSVVPAGWIGLVRFEDGTAWELRYCYWDGTTISRGANAFVASSTGSALSLSSSAMAAMIGDANDVQPHIGTVGFSICVPLPGAATINSVGAANTNLGTPTAEAISATDYLHEQPRLKWTSGTTANAAAGVHMGTSPRIVHNTTAGRGGGEFTARFGTTQLPTGPRLFIGLQTAINSSVAEPSSYTNTAMFGKDSTDTNIQFMTNDAAGTASKVDTGIPFVTGGWYEASIWVPPGGGKFTGLLIRLDTGDIWYGEVTSDIPANGSLLIPTVYGSLSATTGTALVLHVGAFMTRTGM